MEENKMKKYPPWVDVAEMIRDRVETEGFGFLISWPDLRKALDLEIPDRPMRHDELEKIQFDTLDSIERLKTELLFKYQIYLSNDRGTGYRTLHPSEQVTEGFDKVYKKLFKIIRKASDVLVNARVDMLSAEARKALDNNLGKVVFIRKAMNKRNLPPINKGRKKLTG